MKNSAPGRSQGHRHHTLRIVASCLALGALVAACSDGGSGGSNDTIDLVVQNPDRCDPLDPRHCLLPFPNDFFTVADGSTDTGLRVNIATASAVRNVKGVNADMTEWNRNDGFSPGSQIATYVDGIDLPATGLVDVGSIGDSLKDDAPAVVIDTATGERIPYWTELDATVSSPTNAVLFIRPAKNLLEGHRHIVALRSLKDASGATIAAGDVFRAFRDHLISNVPEVEARRDHFEQIFGELKDAGIDRKDLYLAWDFTVASERNLSERLLHLRDDGFARLGDASPAFTVANVEENVDDRILRRVTGTFQVPLYLTGAGQPGQGFNYGGQALPQANGTYAANFDCIVPRSATAADGSPVPARPSLYGHGLLGAADEVGAGNVRSMANEHNFVFCATNWIGLAEEDVPTAVQILQDISGFPAVADRLQQGVLDMLFLGRLMIHPNGLVSHPAFAGLIDRSELYYDGNSQGGIMGGVTTAVATDFTRAVLGVPGINYSILLQRSVDWDTYRQVYDPSYPDEIERGLGLLLLQMLWDRGEADGYAQHITDDPLPNTPAHTVLMHVAFGDHQVSPDAAQIEARTIGAHIHTPTVAAGRLSYAQPYWNIPAIDSYPFGGSAIVIWDSGAPQEPLVNLPPREGDDPHGDPRSDPDARAQKSEFLKPNGAVVDVCSGQPCTADPS